METIALVIPPMETYANSWLPHLGFGYLSSILVKSGYKAVVVDAVAEHLSREKLLERLRNINPSAIFLSATTSEVSGTHDIALGFKEDFPHRPVVVGGAHSSGMLRETLEHCPAFDIAVAGEGEHLIVDLITAVLENRGISTFKGIAFRQGGQISVTEPANPIEDLNRLPFPHWDPFPKGGYLGMFQLFSGLEIPIMASRGCPYDCSFCQRALGKRVRSRSVKSVVEEVGYAISKGAVSVWLNDETFTLHRQWVVRFCESLISKRLPESFYWYCQTRADLVDAELLDLMKKAGCRVVVYGAESFDDYVLKGVKKNITREQVIKAVSLTKAAGMEVYLTLIFGLPNHSRSSILSTISTLLSLPVDYVTISLLTPYPGTEIRQMANSGERGLRLRSEDWDDYHTQTGGALELEGLKHSHLRLLQLYAYIRFYFRPTRVRKMFRLVTPKGILKPALGILRSRMR